MAIKKVPANPIRDLNYADGDKQVFSVRLPEQLIKQIEKAAAKDGWSKSELTQIVLDQYLSSLSTNKK